MKITILKDDGEEIVFQEVIDALISVRQIVPISSEDGTLMQSVQCRSQSWGANPREIIKEMRQSIYEMQRILDGRNS